MFSKGEDIKRTAVYNLFTTIYDVWLLECSKHFTHLIELFKTLPLTQLFSSPSTVINMQRRTVHIFPQLAYTDERKLRLCGEKHIVPASKPQQEDYNLNQFTHRVKNRMLNVCTSFASS